MTPPRIIPVGEEPPPMESPKPAPSDNGRKRPQGWDGGKAKGKTGQRFAQLNAFADYSLAGLTRAEIAVWLILFRDTREGSARTGVTDLARRCGCDRSTAFRALRVLERRGLLKIVHRGGLGKGPSRYRVLPVPQEQ
jgi:hypothetical protein